MRPILAITLAILAGGCPYHGRSADTDAPPGVADGPPGPDGPPGQIDAPMIDAPPPDAQVDARPCPSTPAGCLAFSCGTPSCYYVCAPEEWAAAQGECQSAGVGCLATIDDELENLCINANTAPAFPNLVWFGFTQSPSGAEPGGGWGWACGSSSFAAANWGGFEPNDDGDGEDCGAMNAGGVWLDGGCDTELRYVCEVVP